MQNASIHKQTPAQAAKQASNRSSQAPVTHGSVVQLTCERLALGGKGVCFQSGSPFVILCERALPGEHLLAHVHVVHKGYAEAVKLQSLKLHDNAVPAACPHFGTCGGCTLQSMTYSAQLAEKQNQVLQTLRRVGKLDISEPSMLPALGCDMDEWDTNDVQMQPSNSVVDQVHQHSQHNPTDGAALHGVSQLPVPGNPSTHVKQPSSLYRYRNKLLFTFSSLTWEPDTDNTLQQGGNQISDADLMSRGQVTHRPTLGFLRPGTADQVIPISDCHLAPQLATTIMHTVAKHANDLGLLPYNDPSGKGIMKHVMIRGGARAWLPADQATTNGIPGNRSTTQHMSQGSGLASEQAGSGVYLVVIATTVASTEDVKKLQVLAEKLASDIPQVAGVLHKQLRTQHGNSNQAGTNVSKDFQISQLSGRRNRPVSKKAVSTANLSQQSAKATTIAKNNNGLDASKAQGDDNESFVGAQSQLLVGTSHIIEHLCGLQFRISAESFFQTNTSQAEVLYQAVGRAAQLRPTDTLLDLYCGTGSIGLCLASQCKHVLGYEAIEAAVVDARFNARLNNITNATFVCGDLENGLMRPSQANNKKPHTKPVKSLKGVDVTTVSSQSQKLISTDGHEGDNSSVATWQRPDVVVVNPARAGLSQAVVTYLRACGARRIVYVSCNPATQARDLSLLCNPATSTSAAPLSNTAKKGKAQASSQIQTAVADSPSLFKLVSIQPVDLFPHTDHVENIAVLDRI